MYSMLDGRTAKFQQTLREQSDDCQSGIQRRTAIPCVGQDYQSAPQPSAHSKLHLRSTIEDMESMTTGEHDKIEIVPRLILCY